MSHIKDIDKFIDFLMEHRITSDQYLYLMLYAIEKDATRYRYIEKVRGLTVKQVEDLVKRGYLINNNEPNQYYHDQITITPWARNIMLSDVALFAEEFWEAYPLFIWVDGKKFAARNMDRDEFIGKYMNRIGSSEKKHKEVMEVLHYAVSNNLINVGIKKFVGSEMWNSFKEEMTKDTTHEQFGTKEF